MRVVYVFAIFASVCVLYDTYNVYVKVHEINMLIQSQIHNTKVHSIVASYISTPHVKDPIEILISVVNYLFMIWFVAIAYSFLYCLRLIQLPFFIFRHNYVLI